MNKNIKNFISSVRALNINLRLSPDKTFVIYEPPLPVDMIQTAIDLTDDICIYLDNESLLLSDEDAKIIDSLIDSEDVLEHSTFKLTNPITSDEEENLPIVYEEMTSESFDRDFDFIRKNLKDISTKGTKALGRMISVAQESQHPRAYEVVATLMKTIADVNKDLLDSHIKKQDKSPVSPNSGNTTNVQNNTVFVGSTSELSKLLGKKNL
jgi:hypothetical protein